MGLVAREPKRNQRSPLGVSMVKRMGAPSWGSVQVKALLLVRGMTYRVPASGWAFSMSRTAATRPEGSLGWVPPSTSMESPSCSPSST